MVTITRRRRRQFIDGKYAATATSTDGFTLDSSVQHSGAIAVNRLLAKTLTGDPNTLDGVPEGTTYNRVVASDQTGNRVDFSKALLNKQLDNIPDGTTYARIVASHISSGVAYNFKGAWSSVTAYVIGDEVAYTNNYWVALAANTNSAPTVSNANWQAVFGAANTALVATTTDGKTTSGVTISSLLGTSTQSARTAGLVGIVLNASTTSTTDVTLGTISMPANTIDSTSRAIRITIWGRTSGGTGSGVVGTSMFFGVGAPALSVANGVGYKIIFECTYPTVGASGSLAYQYWEIAGTTINALGTNTFSGANMTASATATVTGHVTVNTTTLFMDGFHAEWIST